METDEQIRLVRKLNSLKGKIFNSKDREAIALYIQEIIKISIPVEPSINERLNNRNYKFEGKQRMLTLLESDLSCVVNQSYPDWETVHFQVASTIVMLILIFVDGGISRIEEIIN